MLSDDDKSWISNLLTNVITDRLEATEGKLRAEIQQAKDETIAVSRDMQTEVLRFVANMAEGSNVRMRHVEANAGNMETAERLRLAALEERLLRIEKRVLGDAKS